MTLVAGPYFRLDRIDGAAQGDWRARYAQGPLLVVPLAGTVTVDGTPVHAGACAFAAGVEQIACTSDPLFLVAQAVMG